MSRDLAHLAFFFFFFFLSFSISLVCIGFFIYLSVRIYAMDNMRKRERCHVHTIT
jgi:hypothetical protein